MGRTRTVRVAAANEGADAESLTSSDTEGGDESQEGSEDVVEENWIEWLERTARAIGAQINKGAVGG